MQGNNYHVKANSELNLFADVPAMVSRKHDETPWYVQTRTEEQIWLLPAMVSPEIAPSKTTWTAGAMDSVAPRLIVIGCWMTYGLFDNPQYVFACTSHKLE